MKRIIEKARRRSRRKRRNIFLKAFNISPETTILDLGGHDGSHIMNIIRETTAKPANIYLGDIDEDAVKTGAAKFGFTSVVLDHNGMIPYSDGFFDIVFCSSVIEHMTGPKERMIREGNGKLFKQLAWENQKKIAEEIRRVGKSYFVQTPYRWFPIESHTQFPCAGYLPRKTLLTFISITNRVWIKKTQPDWHLLTKRELMELFPESHLIKERFFLFTKSLVALKN